MTPPRRCLPVIAALLTTSCFFGGGDNAPPPDGALVLDWTVEGSKSPRACRDTGADSLDLVIQTADGLFVDEITGACEDFELSVQLLPDVYTLDAVLLDARGQELTTAVTDRIRVHAFESSLSAIDFPTDSFF